MPLAAKGYVEGMRLSAGQPEPGVGGGICQASNLLVWLVLHSPLTVTEQSTHSFDPFPDNERVVPWGVSATIVYNYVDLTIRNDTETTFQWRVRVEPQFLVGELRADTELTESYRVEARGEQFLRWDGRYFRRNQMWRTVRDVRTGETVRDELLRTNCALVRYAPSGVTVLDVA